MILKTMSLTKKFGSRTAVDNLSLSVRRGDVFGFLGPNGAGKTTTIRMMVGLIKPTSGEIEVGGYDIRRNFLEAIKRVGSMVEIPAFYNYLSARVNLRLYGLASGGVDEDRIEEVVGLVGLSGRADDKVKVYSHGMKQRLGIAQTLLARPEVIILDEPTNGLDPGGMAEIRELIRRLAGEEKVTIFLSSHLLSEIEQICNRVGIINHGRLLAEGPVSSLKGEEGEEVRVEVDRVDEAYGLLTQESWVKDIERNEGRHLTLHLEGYDSSVLNRFLVEKGYAVYSLTPQSLSLEEYFLKLTQGDETVSSV